MAELEERIKQRAYEIWEQEGCPQGRHTEHWERARREIMDETGEPAPEVAEMLAKPGVEPTPASPKGDGASKEKKQKARAAKEGGGAPAKRSEKAGGKSGRSRAVPGVADPDPSAATQSVSDPGASYAEAGAEKSGAKGGRGGAAGAKSRRKSGA